MLTSLFQWLHWLKNCRPVGRSRPRPPRRAVARRHSFIPRLDFLEDRTVPTTFTVSNLADSGTGSLRSAIMAANSNPGVIQSLLLGRGRRRGREGSIQARYIS